MSSLARSRLLSISARPSPLSYLQDGAWLSFPTCVQHRGSTESASPLPLLSFPCMGGGSTLKGGAEEATGLLWEMYSEAE